MTDSLPSDSTLDRINRICDDFEDAWSSGANPKIEDYVADLVNSDRRLALSYLLILELEFTCDREEWPELPAYKTRFPQDAETVDSAFAELSETWESRVCGDCSSIYAASRNNGDAACPHCGIDLGKTQVADCEDAASIGAYRVIRKLGEGQFGIVYLAYDERRAVEVAIKVPKGWGTASANVRERFRKDARAASKLSHANIVTCHLLGEADSGEPFIVFEYITGRNLEEEGRERARRQEGFSSEEAADLIANLARGLAHAHERGVIHRDVKPSNILIDLQQQPYLTDFGLARITEKMATSHMLVGEGVHSTHDNTILGTPYYMSPEQARLAVKEVDGQSDVYSLGVVLFEILTGTPLIPRDLVLWPEVQLHILNAPLPKLDRSIPEKLRLICSGCLKKQKSERYPTAAALADDLDCYLQNEPLRGPPRLPFLKKLRQSAYRRWRILLGLLLVVLAVPLILTLGHNYRLQNTLPQYRERLKGARDSLDLVLNHIESEESKLEVEMRESGNPEGSLIGTDDTKRVDDATFNVADPIIDSFNIGQVESRARIGELSEKLLNEGKVPWIRQEIEEELEVLRLQNIELRVEAIDVMGHMKHVAQIKPGLQDELRPYLDRIEELLAELSTSEIRQVREAALEVLEDNRNETLE